MRLNQKTVNGIHQIKWWCSDCLGPCKSDCTGRCADGCTGPCKANCRGSAL
ncbi:MULTISPECIES: hypothetical protein [Clostridium]|uniref:hypothetical protein n=1 Tax=Clostridium botulinum TaxID=1491 RepID=UPI000A5BA0E5|nr:hypothetical protein [Clostridium botulinum]MDU2831504.1 hypothetical protein [Clostridium botulinum]MDU4545909.1 hypothetical protein [Clostridium botulinum]MDU5116425.1 hypothetical protein [Clostridium botulinum]